MAKITRVDIPEGVVFNDTDSGIKLTVRDEDGEPVDCSGFGLLWELREAFEDESALITKTHVDGISVGGDFDNEVTIELGEDDLNPSVVPPGEYVHMLRRNDTGVKRPICYGSIIVMGAAARD